MTLSSEEIASVVVSVTSVEETGIAAMLALSIYFVGKVSDEKTGNVSTRVTGWQYLRWMSI